MIFFVLTGTLLYYGYVVAYLIPVMNCFFLDSTWFIVLVAINRYFRCVMVRHGASRCIRMCQ